MSTSPAHVSAGPALVARDDDVFGDLSPDAFLDTPLWLIGDVTDQILDLYTRGRIVAQDAERALESLVVTEADGTSWSMGATSRRWFTRSPGGSWTAAMPPADPDRLAGPVTDSVQAAMRALGVNPDDVDLTATEAPGAQSEVREDEDLLDNLIDGYTE